MIKVIVLDNDVQAIQQLEAKLDTYSDINYLGSFAASLEALSRIRSSEPNLIFLGIDDQGFDAVELASILADLIPNVQIIFMASDGGYAVDAYAIGIVDYLLKPFTKERMDLAMDKVRLSSIKRPKKEVTVKSFGSFNLIDKNNKSMRWRTRKAKELFVFLWINTDTSINRDIILEKIFPKVELKKASTLLSTTLYQMRGTLSTVFEGDVVSYVNNGYKLMPYIPSDYDTLRDILAMEDYSEDNYYRLKELYLGEFLEEEGYEWSTRFTEQITIDVKRFLVRFAERLRDGSDNLLLEDILLFSYELDKMDESIALGIIDFYNESHQTLKVKVFYKKHKYNMFHLLGTVPSKKIEEAYNKTIENNKIYQKENPST